MSGLHVVPYVLTGNGVDLSVELAHYDVSQSSTLHTAVPWVQSKVHLLYYVHYLVFHSNDSAVPIQCQ